jgi:hypothetical protein
VSPELLLVDCSTLAHLYKIINCREDGDVHSDGSVGTAGFCCSAVLKRPSQPLHPLVLIALQLKQLQLFFTSTFDGRNILIDSTVGALIQCRVQFSAAG